mgnify:CR=1 FL=1
MESIEKGSYIQKAEAIHSLIDRITCHWETVPPTDGRYKSGNRTICRAVTIESKATAKDTEGQPIETLTIETRSVRNSSRPDRVPGDTIERCSQVMESRRWIFSYHRWVKAWWKWN